MKSLGIGLGLMFYLLVILIFYSCNNAQTESKDTKTNRQKYLGADDSLPVLELNLSEDAKETRSKLNNLFGVDLCQECRNFDFLIPLQFEGEDIHIKIATSFNEGLGENDNHTHRIRNSCFILLNCYNQILVRGRYSINMKELENIIWEMLSEVFYDKNSLISFNEFEYFIMWDKEADKVVFDSLIHTICKTHLDFIDSEILGKEKDIESLSEGELQQLRKDYPLTIKLNLGKVQALAPDSIAFML